MSFDPNLAYVAVIAAAILIAALLLRGRKGSKGKMPVSLLIGLVGAALGWFVFAPATYGAFQIPILGAVLGTTFLVIQGFLALVGFILGVIASKVAISSLNLKAIG